MVLCGVPRSGKSTFWKRLTDKEFKPSELSQSTGAAESHFLSAHVHSEMLFDLRSCRDHGDLDRQALTIYRQILESQHRSHIQASGTEGESPPNTENKSPSNKEDRLHRDIKIKAPPGTQDRPSSDRKDASSPGEKEKSKDPRIEVNSTQVDDHPDSQTHTASRTTDQSPDPIIIEIGEHFNKLTGLLQKGEELPDIPSKIEKMCHLQDTGGQRAFLELLPTLSVGKALYLLFFNYKDFKTKAHETVQVGGSSEEKPTGTEYDQIDVIMQSLICLSTASSTNVALLVGTHVDEVKSEDISDVNDTIYEQVKPFLNKPLVYAESKKSRNEFLKDKLVLKVAIKENDLCKHEPEHYGKVVKDIVENEIKCDESEKLPASWYMFIIMLHRLQNAGFSVLQYSHCQYIADRLNIQRSILKSLLFRLQKVLGIVLYFPEVKGLEDIVICDPGFVYKSISFQIFKSFEGRSNVPLSQKLTEQGMFKYNELEKRCKIKQQSDLEIAKLITLLEHLGIIAEVQQTTGPQHGDKEKHSEAILSDQEYLIPCVLKDAKGQKLEVQILDNQACSVAPLRIYFDCQFAPMGGFCYLFTKLVSNNKHKGWQLQPELIERRITYWKNKVTFRVDKKYFVTLLSTDMYYEIHIIHSGIFKLTSDGYHICERVWKAIHTILDDSPNKLLQEYKTACICTDHLDDDQPHAMIFDCKPLECTSQVTATCAKNATSVFVNEQQPSVMVWFKEPHIHVKENSDEKIILYFKSDGTKTPKCQWRRDDSHKVENDNKSYEYNRAHSFELSIGKVEGKYVCTATAEKSKVSTTIEVIVGCDLEIKQHPKNNRSIKYGDSVTLSVLAVGAEHYEWMRKVTIGAQVLQCHLTVISMKANDISIENLNEVYNLTLPYCAKWESLGRELGIDQGSLDATRMNRINSEGVEGCLHEMLAKWLRDNKPKPTRLALNRALESVSVGYNGQKKDAKYIGADGPTLTINGFSSDDQGEYWCVIKNRHQSVPSNPANMALDLQILMQPKGNSMIKYHDNGEPPPVTLSVSAVGSGDLSYQWKKDGKDISDSIKCNGTCEPCITINGFSTDDQGEYWCVINNSHKTVQSNSAKLALELQILEHPDGNSVIKYHNGEPPCVTLSVTAVGSGDLSYLWKKDGKDISDSKCSGTCEPTLTINGFSTDDQGEYCCVINNSHKTIKSKSAKMELDLQILDHPQENSMINCCETVTLNVSAVGSGDLSYQWKKDGPNNIIDPNCIGIKESKLVIPSFRHKHQGRYKCEIKDNHKNTESDHAELKLRKTCQILGGPYVVALAVFLSVGIAVIAVILKFL